MSPRRAAVLALAVLFAAASLGCAAEKNAIPDDLRAALENADQFELLSLDPKPSAEKPRDGFHGYKVLGQTVVKDADARKKLVDALKKGVAEHDGRVADCFNPRHGIRVTQGGKTAELVICFECYQAHAYLGDKETKGFLLTASPQATFDGVLRDAKVPLPEPRKPRE